MFEIFTLLADWSLAVLALDPGTRLGGSVHFFVEDTSKIFVLLWVMIYLVATLRASLDLERVRDRLAKQNPVVGYLLGALFGAVTPFCSCSSIPLFLGFTLARIPVGISFAFLITSPLINEVAVVLLGSLLGLKFTVVYILVGLGVGVTGGALMDLLGAERYLKPFVKEALNGPNPSQSTNQGPKPKLGWPERHQYAKRELFEILGRIWKWVILGVGVGALLHGFVPQDWVTTHLGAGQWWSVPLAVLLGIPLYANATGIIPVMETLIQKGLPVGTTLAFSMSVIAASFPEFVLLKQVMEWRLLWMLWVILLVSFTLVGWFFNAYWGVIHSF